MTPRIRKGGRPPVANPVKGRDREGYNAYMRVYMRAYRARRGARSRYPGAPPPSAYASLSAFRGLPMQGAP